MWTDRYIWFLQPKRRCVHPAEVDVGNVGLDREVERQGVVVNDAIATVVQFTGDTCIVTAHNTYLYTACSTPSRAYSSQVTCREYKDTSSLTTDMIDVLPRGQRLHCDICDMSVSEESVNYSVRRLIQLRVCSLL